MRDLLRFTELPTKYTLGPDDCSTGSQKMVGEQKPLKDRGKRLTQTYQTHAMVECPRGGLEMQQTTHIKEEALRLIESLPDDATWEDLTRLMLERQMIEEGITDLEAGRVWTSDEIREKLGSAVVYTLGGSAQGNFHLGQVTSDKICIAAPPGSYTALTVTSMDIPRVSGPEADLARRAIAANFPPKVCVPLFPTITLVDVHATEMDCVCLPGKPGPVPGTVRFRVTLSNLSARTVTVQYGTADGSAKAGTDYGAISSNLTIPSLSSSIDIRVGLRCRKAIQGDRTFTLTLSSPINGLLARSQAQGVIVDSDDDGSCPGTRPRP